ncbi:MAG: ornithine carbamoyltransferase [Alphaproteobacteria bacterium]
MPDLRHFLNISEVDTTILRHIFDLAGAQKAKARPTQKALPTRLLAGKTLAMIFEKPSTRTRVSFEVAITQLGGHAVILDSTSSQLSRGETIADTARTLSRYVDAIMLRTVDHSRTSDMAANASVPVINGLSHQSHPCQVMADIMTFEEHRGSIAGKVVTWTGDGNNMANSWIHAASRLDFGLRIACPAEFAPRAEDLQWASDRGADVMVTTDPLAAADGADLVVTDTWVSMGDDQAAQRHNLLAPFQVDNRLMGRAKSTAIFMHCLPAHRGEEVTAEVMDGPQSVVWDEAENRLHVQKGILLWCLGADDH